MQLQGAVININITRYQHHDISCKRIVELYEFRT